MGGSWKQVFKQNPVRGVLLLAALGIIPAGAVLLLFSGTVEKPREIEDVQAENLRVEYAVNPVGIDVARPRFSWTLASSARDVRQKSYRILVATSQADLANGPYIWDSGVKASDLTVGITYGGKALSSTTRYYWKVVAQTNVGTTDCAPGAFWETGFMDTTMASWSGATWISRPASTLEDIFNYTIEYDFRVVEDVAGFVFGATGDYFLMWQINMNTSGRDGVQTDGMPTLRPHRWNTDAASLENIRMDGVQAPQVIPNTPQGRTAWYTVRLEATRLANTTQTYVTTSMRPAGSNAPFTVIEERRLDFHGPFGPGDNSWPLGRIGFRQHRDILKETADFTRIRVWNNEGIPAGQNTAANLVFAEDFSAPSQMFPDPAIIADAGHPEGLHYIRLENISPYRGVRAVMGKYGDDNEPLFRTAFRTHNAAITRARLYATARGYYEFSLNGEKIGDQYLSPGWSDYFHTIMYQTYDITDRLTPDAEHTLGAMTGKGWFSGPHQMVDGSNYSLYGDTQSVLGKMVITYEDGTEQVIVTDDTWLYHSGPILYADNYRGEGFDARLALAGWNDAGYADLTDWVPALEVTSPGVALVGQVEPPIREVARFSPVEVTPASYPTRRTFDAGQNIAGFITLRVRGNAGDTITIRHAEMLNTPSAYMEGGQRIGNGDGPVGTIYRENLRNQFAGGYQVAVDTYILRGDPDGEEWTPRFTFHGFRYFEITGATVEILSAQAIAISSDNQMLSAFETSHPLVNQLFNNIIWGMRGNHVGVPTDCPNRDERLGYTGDAQIFARTASYLQNADPFYSRWLRDVRAFQSAQVENYTGQVAIIAPNNPNSWSGNWSSGWSDAAVIVPWQLFQMYGDTQIIRDSYDSMKGWCDFLLHPDRSVGNLRRLGGAGRDMNFGDWVAVPLDLPDDFKRLTNSMYMAYSHLLFARMARAIGDPYKEADVYESRARAITDAILAEYFNRPGYGGMLTHSGAQDNGGLAGGYSSVERREKQTAYAMMLYFGLDPQNNALYAQRLASLIDLNDGRLTSGFLGVAYLAPTLSANGFTETAYTLLEQESFPSWIYSINQGATTIWERWNSYTVENGFGPVEMNSFNHYSFGSIGQWLMSGVLGIERNESNYANAGFHQFVLNPQVGGTLTYAKGHYDAISGRIASDWTLDEDGTFTYRITIPANTAATVYVPSASANATVLESGTNAADAEGVTFLRYDDATKQAVFAVASGTYEFVSTK